MDYDHKWRGESLAVRVFKSGLGQNKARGPGVMVMDIVPISLQRNCRAYLRGVKNDSGENPYSDVRISFVNYDGK